MRCFDDISARNRENKARYSAIIVCITFAQYCMGYSNGSNAIAKTPETRQKRPAGIGFSLTADGHYHIRKKRLTNVSSPVDYNDTATKKFVTDILKTKAGTTYVNNELATLKKRVKVLESTVDKLQKTVEFYAKQLKPVSE